MVIFEEGSAWVCATALVGVPEDEFGALLVGVGALLLLADALFGPPGITAITLKGTLPTPLARLSAGAELVGALLVSIGSALLLLASRGLTALAVVVVVAIATLLIYLIMARSLRAHMCLLAAGNPDEPVRSWAWCLLHPMWRPPD